MCSSDLGKKEWTRIKVRIIWNNKKRKANKKRKNIKKRSGSFDMTAMMGRRRGRKSDTRVVNAENHMEIKGPDQLTWTLNRNKQNQDLILNNAS